MNIYQQDDPERRYLFLDWEEIGRFEADIDGITIELLAHHPLLSNQE